MKPSFSTFRNGSTLSTLGTMAWTLGLLVGLSSLAQAQDRPADHNRERGRDPAYAAHAPRLQLDQRYHHDHYYPVRGAVIGALPGGSISVAFGGGSWYFHGGVWFRPLGGRFVVDLPPIGILVPTLPPDCASLWIGGASYCYANGVYYAPVAGQGYAVVAPPAGAETAQPVPAAPAARGPQEPIAYPRNGQAPEQAEADAQACRRWATAQPAAQTDAQAYQRAMAACLDGRGYTVR